MTTRHSFLGAAAAAGGLFLLGTSAPFSAQLQDYPLLGGQAIRFAIASVILLGVLALRRTPAPNRLDLTSLLRVAALGLFGIGGFTVSLVVATEHADPALVGAVLAATPVLLAMIGPLRERRAPTPRVVAGCLVITIGTIAAGGLGAAGTLGLLLCGVALVADVAFSVLATPLIDRFGALHTTAYAVTAAAILLGALAPFVDGAVLPRMPSWSEAASLVYLAAMVGIIANVLWYAAIPRLGLDLAGLFYAFLPMGALAAGLVLGTSVPEPSVLIGLSVVVVGLLIGLAPGRRAQRERDPRPAARQVGQDEIGPGTGNERAAVVEPGDGGRTGGHQADRGRKRRQFPAYQLGRRRERCGR